MATRKEEPEELFKAVLTLENGTYRELISFDEQNTPIRLLLTKEQADALLNAVETQDVEYMQSTGLAAMVEKWSPQLALTENKKEYYWITGDPASDGAVLRVVAVEIKRVH